MGAGPKTKIGIMGGTFDPIHYGHLYIAECARHRFSIDKVLFIPTGNPGYKKRTDIVNPAARLEMTRLAIMSNPYFDISSIEAERSGPTYTVDTLEQLYNKGVIPDRIFFITGADAILEILTWKDVSRIFELCEFIAVTRPGYSFAEINQALGRLTAVQKNRIHFHETGGILISSTDIRNLVRQDEPITYLVPDEVKEYIKKQQLYK